MSRLYRARARLAGALPPPDPPRKDPMLRPLLIALAVLAVAVLAVAAHDAEIFATDNTAVITDPEDRQRPSGGLRPSVEHIIDDGGGRARGSEPARRCARRAAPRRARGRRARG